MNKKTKQIKPVTDDVNREQGETYQKQDATPTGKDIILEKIKANASIIVALIGALATILSGGLALNNQKEIAGHKEKINALNAEIAQRDAQISLLRDEIENLKHPLQEILAQNGKAGFEWQWAGENWYGQVILEQQGTQNVISQAQVGLLGKNLDDHSSMAGQVLNMVPGTGIFNIKDDTVQLQFSTMKKDRRFGTINTVIIAGDLQQTLCYVGKVSYKNIDTGNQYSGDMILVNHITLLGEQIDNWFAPNIDQPWFERYFVDN